MPHQTVLLTMGDLCGIGPEIVAKVLGVCAAEGGDSERRPQRGQFVPDLQPHSSAMGQKDGAKWTAAVDSQPPTLLPRRLLGQRDRDRDETTRLCVVGDVAVMRRAMAWAGVKLPLLHLTSLQDLDDLPPRCVPVWQPAGLPAGLLDCPMGQVDARAGAAAGLCIAAAVAEIQAGRAGALVTAPIHKEAWHAAGIVYPGHTEMLQALAANGAELAPVRMMLANNELRTVLVTIHCSLRRAIELISVDSVLETLRITQAAMLSFGIGAPRIAVAGLNPHAGEGGLFGDEEILHIAPAIARARAEGINASGPFAPDTVFMRARNAAGHPGEFDVVVAMTHDHGLIPVKYLGVEQGVNVTLGLPFVRTSPDHGTAFDLAGSGRADASSLRAALQMACQLLTQETGQSKACGASDLDGG